MDVWLQSLLSWLALPSFGLSTLFVVAVISATLLPLGSEPALLGLLYLQPDLFWPAIAVATAGNTLGGAISWWTGYGAEKAWEHVKHRPPREMRLLAWLQRFGPKACLLSWLPLVGDPLCALAGWSRLPFWPCVGYMLIGKAGRYLVMTTLALHWFGPAVA
ncbi:MAG TPA: YqaA family protein [Ideonella sp.]|uniref:YqaA family protein n=1 Tax=Ideonella sp. TaxID=1929293 RepID=UPI002C5DFC79|nr:YqaA family protein [Ideonella sp.]HSI51116.1 YqaA family protein [Ideonella sp.]